MTEEVWFPTIDKELCIGCGECIDACPTEALELVNGTAVITNPTACNYSAGCEAICPVDAITVPYQIVLEADL